MPLTTGIEVCQRLAVSVNDAAARQVVRRQLDLDPVTGIDPDPEAAHLAGGVAERLMAVVELDLEQTVRESLDDLALHLDLLFLGCYLRPPELRRAPVRDGRAVAVRYSLGTAAPTGA